MECLCTPINYKKCNANRHSEINPEGFLNISFSTHWLRHAIKKIWLSFLICLATQTCYLTFCYSLLTCCSCLSTCAAVQCKNECLIRSSLGKQINLTHVSIQGQWQCGAKDVLGALGVDLWNVLLLHNLYGKGNEDKKWLYSWCICGDQVRLTWYYGN